MTKREIYRKAHGIMFQYERRHPPKYDFRKYVWMKHQIARLMQPKSILEIGVRAGYSAWAMLKAVPNATYLGLDAYIRSHGGLPEKSGVKQWAEHLLDEFPHTDIVVTNTQDALHRYPTVLPTVELYHIDGDHSYKGAINDLEWCHASMGDGGVLLVDDYDYIKHVKRATHDFAQRHRLHIGYIPTPHGDAVLTKGPTPEWVNSIT